MTTYLVTGGAGFIGSNFVLYVLRKHDDVRVVNVDALTYAGNLENLASVEDDPRHTFVHADIRDAEAMAAVLAEYDPDFVINFAAESHVDRSIENPGVFADTNVMGTVNLLNCCRAAWSDGKGGFGNHRYLQVGTDEVYGTLAIPEAINPDGSPADPEHTDYFRESTPLSPHSPYSASKCSADLFVRAYYDTYGFPAVITRCSNNYGPYQFPEKLIPLFINNIRHKKPLPVYGKGENVRDWLFVEDHARAIDVIFHNGKIAETYNSGGFNEWKNIDIIKVVIKTVDKLLGRAEGEDLNLITYVTDRLGHDARYAIDSTKLQKELGWEPSLQFEEGIEKTVRWYLDNQEWLDNITSGDYEKYYEKMYGDRT